MDNFNFNEWQGLSPEEFENKRNKILTDFVNNIAVALGAASIAPVLGVLGGTLYMMGASFGPVPEADMYPDPMEVN